MDTLGRFGGNGDDSVSSKLSRTIPLGKLLPGGLSANAWTLSRDEVDPIAWIDLDRFPGWIFELNFKPIGYLVAPDSYATLATVNRYRHR